MPASRASKKRKKKDRASRKPVSTLAATVVTSIDEPKLRGEIQAEARTAEAGTDEPRTDEPRTDEPRTDEAFDFSSPVWRERIAPSILLILVTFALYIQVVHHPFTNYDDGEYVQQNVQIQQGITGSMLRWAFVSLDHANWHPVTWISHAVDWQLFGASPAGHHVMSLLLHIATVVLLFLVLAEITGSALKSLLVAGLFAIHPVSVESVTWIAERKNILCTLFFMAALFAYGRYARRPRMWSYLAVGLLFALSLASKAMTVTFPFVLLLLDFWPLRRIDGWTVPSADSAIPQFKFSRLVLEKVPFLVLSIADSVITVIAQRQPLHDATKFGLVLRLENALASYTGYLWNALWPTHLSVLYPFPSSGLPAWKVIAGIAILAGGSILAWRERSHGYLLTGWCWFLGTLVPVIGLVQVGEQSMADRYAYLPLIGIYIVAVWGLFDLAGSGRKEWRPIMAGVAALAFVALMFAAWAQVRVWRSNVDLWRHAVSVTTNNRGAEDILADALLEDALARGERYSDEAVIHIQRALQIDPHDSRALFSMGTDLRGRGRPAEAINQYKLALKYEVQDQTEVDKAMRSQILSGMASCYESLGDFVTARGYYQQAIALSPGANADLFLGFARTFTDEEMAKLVVTLTQKPTAQGYWHLGQLQDSMARKNDAHTSYLHALQIDPHFAPAQSALAETGNQPQ